MEILREISDAEIAYIVSELEQRMPYAIKDLYYILAAKRSKEMARNFINISDKILPTFYVPRNGLKENCTIFGITTSDHTVWFFTLEASLQELRDCLEKTMLIRWNDGVLFVTIHSEHIQPIMECVEKNGYKLKSDEPASYYWLQKDEALKYQIR